jgi:hypothetical protein
MLMRMRSESRHVTFRFKRDAFEILLVEGVPPNLLIHILCTVVLPFFGEL